MDNILLCKRMDCQKLNDNLNYATNRKNILVYYTCPICKESMCGFHSASRTTQFPLDTQDFMFKSEFKPAICLDCLHKHFPDIKII